MKHTIICMLFFATGTAAHAASFDCAKAATSIEKTICSDDQISALDNQLMQSYKKSMSTSANADALKSEQRSWLANVRNKCQDAACLRQAYTYRISSLIKVGQPAIVEASTQPKGNEGIVSENVPKVDSPLKTRSKSSACNAARKHNGPVEVVEIPPPAPNIPDIPLLQQKKNWEHKVCQGETADSAYRKALHELKVNRSPGRATELLSYSAYLGSVNAAELLAELHLDGWGGYGGEKAKPLEAKKLFVYADQHGNARATLQLGRLLNKGLAGEKKDTIKAIQFFERAVRNGEKGGILELARIAAFVDAYAGPNTSPEQRNMLATRFGITRVDESAAFAALARVGVSAAEAKKIAVDSVEASIQRRSDDCKRAKELHEINRDINHVNDGFQGC